LVKEFNELVRSLDRRTIRRMLDLHVLPQDLETVLAERYRRLKVYRWFDRERGDQDVEWGGRHHDLEHTAEDWADFIDSQVHKLKEVAERAGSDPNERQREKIKERLVKIGALATAALEALHAD
jgi:hypothetical protein